jgi:hypothetical protein
MNMSQEQIVMLLVAVALAYYYLNQSHKFESALWERCHDPNNTQWIAANAGLCANIYY